MCSVKLEQYLHNMLCDTTLFPVGESLTCLQINKRILENDKLHTTFPNETNKNIRHHVDKLLEVHSNHRDNKYHKDYSHMRDISKVKTSSRYYIYTFGNLL